MNVLKEYAPLYQEDFYQADCWGGRGGARSYSLTQNALYNLLYNKEFRGFFLREVHSTIFSSMWQDLKDRISEYEEIHGEGSASMIEISDNKSGENYAINTKTKATLTTKGFRTSTNAHTANLKSLAGATHLYIDEGDEVAEDEFRKLKISFRKKGVKIKIMRAFNPPFAGHYIWKDYRLIKITADELIDLVFSATDRSLEEVKALVGTNNKTYFRAELKGESLGGRYISIMTNFTHNYDNLNPVVFEEYDKLMIEDFHYFCVNILGLIPNEEGDIVYTDFNRIKNHTDRTVKQGESLHIGMDFNIGQMAAVIHVMEGEKKYAVDELTKVYNTYAMCQAIGSRFPGHKIIVYPDASGQNRNSSGATDVDIIKGFGFTVRVPKKNGFVRDRINKMNTDFRKKNYLVNTSNCPEYTEALEKLKFKKGEPDKSSGYDHVTDAGGYFIVDSNKTKTKVRGSHYEG